MDTNIALLGIWMNEWMNEWMSEWMFIDHSISPDTRCYCSVRSLSQDILLFLKEGTPWPESASKLYRLSDRRLSAKLLPTFEVWGCHVVSTTDPYGRILGFLDQSRYFFFQVAPQLYSRGWADLVPDPLLLRKSGSAGNRTLGLWIGSQELCPLDHRGGHLY
jgi:hypothetical protein